MGGGVGIWLGQEKYVYMKGSCLWAINLLGLK